MREHGMLFSDDMVRALLGGRKTQTRRPVVPQPVAECAVGPLGLVGLAAARVRVGDRIWVREAFAIVDTWSAPEDVAVRACRSPDGEEFVAYRAKWPSRRPPPRWTPSIHMPRWASRLTLDVTGVRAQRVQEISDDDAVAEGVARNPVQEGTWMHYPTGTSSAGWSSPRESYASLWDAAYAARGLGWHANPWVWVYDLRPVGGAVDAARGAS